MPRLTFLGTASALPTSTQDNTSLLCENNGCYVMVDCSGNPSRKLWQLGVGVEALQHLIITHSHIDHVYAVPSLVDALGIAGRETPLHIYALRETMQTIVTLLDLWHLRTRDYCNFPLALHTLEGSENEAVFQDTNFALRTTPTQHATPSVAVKLTFPIRPTLVYSSDTAPCPQLLSFAAGADYFLLENTYCNDNAKLSEITGHFYSQQFRQVASQIAASHTMLVHHSEAPHCTSYQALSQIQAETNLPALAVTIPHDFDTLDLI